MGPSTFGVKSSLTALLLLAFVGLGTTKTILSAKPEIGSKKILVILAMDAPSHHIVFNSLTNALLERGHYVTLVSGAPAKTHHPRKREIFVQTPLGEMRMNASRNTLLRPMNAFQKTMLTYNYGPVLAKSVFSEPKVMALKKENFDLVIVEAFFFQEAFLGFAHHFGCPSIAVNPFGYSLVLNDHTGGAINPAYVMNVFSTVPAIKTFPDRLINTVTTAISKLAYHFYYYPKMNALMHESFPNAPPLYDLIGNLSLTLINNNDALMFTVPLAPSVIQVGGMHIKPGKPLSGDLKKWVEESKEGIVYFSLGSNLRSEMLPTQKLNAITSTFEKLKQRVLIKWSGTVPQNVPANCRFEEWVPQQGILAHPKLRVFVTHGGLLSLQESVHHGAPVIVLPVFGDQQMNAALAVEKGFALTLSIFDLSAEAFEAALSEVISNPKYRENARRLKDLFRSDPVPPLDKAVYYTELLMKLGSLKHLQPASVRLSWYQYLLLDVAAVILVTLWVTWTVIRCILRKLISCCRSTKTKKD